MTPSPEQADVIVVNTCGFIQDAKEESLAAVFDAAASFPNARLAVIGCLVQRYSDDLRRDIPEVDAWFGVEEAEAVAAWAVPEPASEVSQPLIPATGGAWGYVKLSDGCDHLCSFCSIPLIKGPYRSLPTESVLEQADTALSGGARELVLVGQDTALWRDGHRDLPALVEELAADPRLVWLRFMYIQPEHARAELLELIAHHPKVCRYLDLPFQHASPPVLGRMRRQGSTDSHLELLDRVSRLMPDASLRSTFIVGFPGETEDDFEELLRFARLARFDHAGCFLFSPEEGTEAAGLRPRVPSRIARDRLARLSSLLLDVSEEKAAALLGSEVEVLVDGPSGPDCPPEASAVGRTYRQAPEIDGVTYVSGAPLEECRSGSLLKAVVVDTFGYDMMAEYRGPVKHKS